MNGQNDGWDNGYVRATYIGTYVVCQVVTGDVGVLRFGGLHECRSVTKGGGVETSTPFCGKHDSPRKVLCAFGTSRGMKSIPVLSFSLVLK